MTLSSHAFVDAVNVGKGRVAGRQVHATKKMNVLPSFFGSSSSSSSGRSSSSLLAAAKNNKSEKEDEAKKRIQNKIASQQQKKLSSMKKTATTTSTNSGTIQNIVKVGFAVTAIAVLYVYRDQWMSLFDKEFLQSKTLQILNDLDSLPKYQSYGVYTIGMAIWETFGLSTIPVETAAGMVFGWKGFIMSGVGKLLGAVFAFSLARYGILASWIKEKLGTNSFLQLVEESATNDPFLVSILLKFSCFPETIKNYGSAILSPIKLWMFIFGTVVHGCTFSALWTYLGVDTALRLENPSLPADKLLQSLLSLALVNGIVISPLAMAYWIKTLQRSSSNNNGRRTKKG